MTKRILSVLLALVLVLAMSTVALAADTQLLELVVNDTETDRVYEAYQVFAGDLGTLEGQLILSNIVWGNGVTPVEGKIADKTATEWEAALTNESEAKAFADLLGEDGGLKNPYTATEGEGTYTFKVPAGYYLVKETTVLQSGEKVTLSAYILSVVTKKNIAPKRSDVPEVEKDQAEADGSYDVGEEITFTLTSSIPTNVYDKYSVYQFGFKDTLSDGLTFKAGSAKVTVDKVETDAFAFSSTTTAEGETVLTWHCADTIAANIPAGKDIVVTYVATLNDNAVAGTAEENKVVVVYSNNPEDGGEGTNETTPETEIVGYINLDGVKIDGEAEPKTTLKGAEFVLKQGEKFYALNNGVVSWVDSQADAKVMTSDDNGKFSFTGLDAGTYSLVETKAPEGYNLAAPVDVVITSKIENGKVVFSASSPVTVTSDNASATLDVLNNKGTTLPSTGGMGTTIFYVIGGLLMAAAVVLLVAKKRTVNE